MLPTALASHLASSVMLRALSLTYGAEVQFENFLDGHIMQMMAFDNVTIERTGRVLEGCKAGFKIGFAAPIAIIATGQVILGNPLNAVGTVGSALFATNPTAMTCAAIGAVLYGYHALTPAERDALVNKVAGGLDMGVELVKSILAYAIDTMRALFNSDQIQELRRWVRDVAEAFGRHLGDISRTLGDRLTDSVGIATDGTRQVLAKGLAIASSGAEIVMATSASVAGNAVHHAALGYDGVTAFATKVVQRKAPSDTSSDPDSLA